jgi:hypothetical protein
MPRIMTMVAAAALVAVPWASQAIACDGMKATQSALAATPIQLAQMQEKAVGTMQDKAAGMATDAAKEAVGDAKGAVVDAMPSTPAVPSTPAMPSTAAVPSTPAVPGTSAVTMPGKMPETPSVPAIPGR